MGPTPIISTILSFWFGESDSPNHECPKDFWFHSTPELDQQIRDRFELTYQKAIRGNLNFLLDTPEGSLALVLLLDQFPRNMYRGKPQAFASDFLALKIAKDGLIKEFDRRLSSLQRTFFYLPFEHSEDLEDQEESIHLFQALGNKEALQYAVDHRDIIARFGRFPHRNSILGRLSTHEEVSFLEKNISF